MEEEIIFNRFENVLGEYICLHYEEIYFKGMDATKPLIKLCGQTLRIRANDAWSKLPVELKQMTVAHEQSHRELNHYLIVQNNPFYRMGFAMRGTVDPKELEADRLASKTIGRKEYIRRLTKYMEEYAEGMSKTELRYRIKALEDTCLRQTD